MNEEIKVEKFDTKFVMPETRSFPIRFGIVTAFTEKGSPLSNWQADRALFGALIEGGYTPFRIVAIHEGGKRASPGYGFGAPDTKSVQEIAKRFSQSVFFWIKDGKLQTKDTRTLVYEDEGALHEFLI